MTGIAAVAASFAATAVVPVTGVSNLAHDMWLRTIRGDKVNVKDHCFTVFVDPDWASKDTPP